MAIFQMHIDKIREAHHNGRKPESTVRKKTAAQTHGSIRLDLIVEFHEYLMYNLRGGFLSLVLSIHVVSDVVPRHRQVFLAVVALRQTQSAILVAHDGRCAFQKLKRLGVAFLTHFEVYLYYDVIALKWLIRFNWFSLLGKF